jgi:very-short-patch-repair endonuclease
MEPRRTTFRGESAGPAEQDLVLIGVIRRQKDLRILLSRRWYRIPERQKFHHRPSYLAFYQTKSCGRAGGALTHYAFIRKISRRRRKRLLPEEPQHPRSGEWYWQFQLGPVATLPRRIENRFRRRITFAYTTLSRLRRAREIGDLFDVPPLEEVMENILMRAKISFRSQFSVLGKKGCKYRLDFAIFCPAGKIALECDHSRWHALPAQRDKDRRKDRWLRRHGWEVIRFSETEILKQPGETLTRVRELVEKLGGEEDE